MRRLNKVIALTTIFAVLMLAAPGAFAANPGPNKYKYTYVFKKPLALVFSLFSFIPFTDTARYTITTDQNSKNRRGIRITGVLKSKKAGDGD